jgi:hypothetical protein
LHPRLCLRELRDPRSNVAPNMIYLIEVEGSAPYPVVARRIAEAINTDLDMVLSFTRDSHLW